MRNTDFPDWITPTQAKIMLAWGRGEAPDIIQEHPYTKGAVEFAFGTVWYAVAEDGFLLSNPEKNKMH